MDFAPDKHRRMNATAGAAAAAVVQHYHPPPMWPNGQLITPVQVVILTLGPFIYYKAIDWIRAETREAEQEMARRRREARADDHFV